MATVICDRCGKSARIKQYVEDHARLSEVAKKLQMQQGMPAFYVLDCEHCGERIQVADARPLSD